MWLKLPFWIKLALNSKGLRVNIIQNKKTHMYYRSIKERFTVQCAGKILNLDNFRAIKNKRNKSGVNNAIPCHFQNTKRTVEPCAAKFRHLVYITPAKFCGNWMNLWGELLSNTASHRLKRRVFLHALELKIVLVDLVAILEKPVIKFLNGKTQKLWYIQSCLP